MSGLTWEYSILRIFVFQIECNIPRALIHSNFCLFLPPKSYIPIPVTGNARRPISAVLLVLYVTTIRQTVRYTQRPVWLKIYAIRITLYPFPTRYNGFFTGFLRFFTKNQIQFSPERVLRSSQLKLISSNDSGDYKRLLFWSYGFGFEIFGTPPISILPILFSFIILIATIVLVGRRLVAP